MKRKVVKIILVLIMVLGVVFSISNFFSVNLHADKTATWYYVGGIFECIGRGNECDPFAFNPGG
jgi:uncharacterized alpha/beta hydrolase family protein